MTNESTQPDHVTIAYCTVCENATLIGDCPTDGQGTLQCGRCGSRLSGDDIHEYNREAGTATIDLPGSEDSRDLTKAVKDAIRELRDSDDGASVDDVVDHVADNLGVAPGHVEASVRTLKERGEIYQPNKGYVRVI